MPHNACSFLPIIYIIFSDSDYVCEDFDADINFLIHHFFGQF